MRLKSTTDNGTVYEHEKIDFDNRRKINTNEKQQILLYL